GQRRRGEVDGHGQSRGGPRPAWLQGGAHGPRHLRSLPTDDDGHRRQALCRYRGQPAPAPATAPGTSRNAWGIDGRRPTGGLAWTDGHEGGGATAYWSALGSA